MLKHFFQSLALIAAVAVSLTAAVAQPGRSSWDESDYSRVRLLMVGVEDGAGVAGGVEIQLEPGWHTYWRVPGDAGVPPLFDFSGSENVAEVIVDYPVPQRYDDGTSISVIYKDRVVFPLRVKPTDPSRPVTLSLELFYGACSEVCIPVKASVTTSLRRGDRPDPLAKIGIAEFRNTLPQAPQPDFSISSVTRTADGLIIDTVLPEADEVDLFAEGPTEWFVGQPTLVNRSATGARFELPLKGIPDEAEVDRAFNFLLVAGRRGVLARRVRVDSAE